MVSEEAVHHAKSARNLMRLFRSNLAEGFNRHALMYLVKASFELGMAREIAWREGPSRGTAYQRAFTHAQERYMKAAHVDP